jgi:uncharacterized integral membrane protein
MARRLVSTFVVLPLGILLVAFAVANRHSVTVSLDPLGAANPSLSATLPLFLMLLVVLTMGVIAGGIATWFGQGKWRKAARRLDAEAKALRAECANLRTELAAKDQPPATALPAPVQAVA